MSREDNRSCRATTLVAALQRLVAAHGDLPVVTRDADTHWRLAIGLRFRPADDGEDFPRFEITSEFFGRPPADLGAEVPDSRNPDARQDG